MQQPAKEKGRFRGKDAVRNDVGRSQTQATPPSKAPIAERLHRKRRLLSIEELQPWQRENRFILGGYRSASHSYATSFASLTYLHNESVNIFTHLVGTLAFATIASVSLLRFAASKEPTPTTADAFAVGVFLLAAIICLGLSTLSHILCDHSLHVSDWWRFADFMGILALITGSFYPGVFYGFYCYRPLVYTYWSMVSVAGTCCAVACTYPTFRTPLWRQTRTALFVCLALTGIVPIVHALLLYGWLEADKLGLSFYLYEAVFYIVAAAFYISRFPECLWPGLFDTWASSHQCMHVMVLTGAGLHLVGVLKAYETCHDPNRTKC